MVSLSYKKIPVSYNTNRDFNFLNKYFSKIDYFVNNSFW